MKLKRAKVIMLPTALEPYKMPYSNNIPKSNIIKGLQDSLRYQKGLWYDKNYQIGNYSKEMYQHLYITTNDEIKEDTELTKDAWYINTYRGYSEPFKNDNLCNNGYLVKIIATTDKSLLLPQPSQTFIEKYCELGGIKEIDVEYFKECVSYGNIILEQLNDDDSYFGCNGRYDVEISRSKKEVISYGAKFHNSLLKVNSQNEISIHSIKSSWTKQEMMDAWTAGFESCEEGKYHNIAIIKWIKENL